MNSLTRALGAVAVRRELDGANPAAAHRPLSRAHPGLAAQSGNRVARRDRAGRRYPAADRQQRGLRTAWDSTRCSRS